jgi:hypothetical protein
MQGVLCWNTLNAIFIRRNVNMDWQDSINLFYAQGSIRQAIRNHYFSLPQKNPSN